MSQSSYSVDQAAAFEGMLGDAGIKDVVSLVTSTAVAFGRFVKKGATDKSCLLPAAATDITDEKLARGVTCSTHALESGAGGYEAKRPANVVRKGRVWVKSKGAVVAGTSPVHVFYASSTGEGAGSFHTAAVTNETAVMPKAKWLTSAGAGGLALLEIDL